MSQVALITGGQRGIGLGIAKALTMAGFKVAIAAPENKDATEVEQALMELGTNAGFYPHDVRDVDAHEALLDQIEAELGAVTTLVSNAGIASPGRVDMLDVLPENFDLVLNVNLRGAFFLAQNAARRMIANPSPAYRSLIFIGSVSADMVSVERADYCISKSAGSMMASLFAARLAADGIGVFEVRPGIIKTSMTVGVKDKYDQRIADGLVPAGRWGHPNDIANIVLPLATGAMEFATGSTINADGGLSIPRL